MNLSVSCCDLMIHSGNKIMEINCFQISLSCACNKLKQSITFSPSCFQFLFSVDTEHGEHGVILAHLSEQPVGCQVGGVMQVALKLMIRSWRMGAPTAISSRSGTAFLM